MQHASSKHTRARLLEWFALACAATASAQTSLQQAMLRSASPVVAAAPAGDYGAISPSANVADALQQLAAQAGVVFTGSVATVQPAPDGSARVTFRVERGIRSVASGAEYAVRVSAWAGGADCFHPGQRALFLLTAPSVSGFSAPVMGERGIVPLSGDALVGNLDLRWIAADVLRGNPVTSQPVANVRSQAVAAAPQPSATSESEPPHSAAWSTNSLTLPDVHAIDRDLVLDVLRSSLSGPSLSGSGQTRS